MPSPPDAIAAFLTCKAPSAELVGLESGQLSIWHWHALCDLRAPVVCLDARHAKAALSMRIDKTGRGDAEGLAQRIGAKKAKVALARNLAVILYCIWTDGTEFWWTKEAPAI